MKKFVTKGIAIGMAAVFMLISLTGCKCQGGGQGGGRGGGNGNGGSDSSGGEPVVLAEKSKYGNPIAGFDGSGKVAYGGDPSVIVEGDTVYLYVGHDVSDVENYSISEWMCYSSKDMLEWKYESVIMKADKDSIKWAHNNESAWASQVIKYKDKYYFYYCTDYKVGTNKSIGVAVSDSPTGPFTDIGKPLVANEDTPDSVHGWEDIDPTVWVDTDENGAEHRYLVWGNTRLFVCELNEDMISVKDIDGDGKVTYGTDILSKTPPEYFTEAPWLYRRQDENGKYYGPYYMFYAHGWREQMAYATADNPMTGEWKFGGVIMQPTATSNTNHPAVIDFKGGTYFIYHNGSLSRGSGYRRVACVEKFEFNADGSVPYITETATGLAGTKVKIKAGDGKYISHYHFDNSGNDAMYPYVNINTGTDIKNSKDDDYLWEIVQGRADGGAEKSETFVSIEAYNKPGLYLTADLTKGVKLSQDHNGQMKQSQTFKSVKGLGGGGVSFESVQYEGKYMSVVDGKLQITDGSDKKASTFYIEAVK